MYLLLRTTTTQGHHHHHCCERLLAGWKDEGDGTRGKGDDDERWYVFLFCFLFLFTYQVFFYYLNYCLRLWLILRNSRPSTNIQTPSSPCKWDVRPSEWIGDGEEVQAAVEEYWKTREGGCPQGKCLLMPRPSLHHVQPPNLID